MKQQGRIVLASGSPRRKAFLEKAGLNVEAVPSDIAEVGYGGDPALLPLRITRQKVKAVRHLVGDFDGWVIGADTVVALEKESFGKPRDATEARSMLRRLSGKTHQVFTGFRVEGPVGDFREETVVTEVEMIPLNDAQIDWYIETGEPFDKAGGYALQENGGLFVTQIKGSYSNVVGLPMAQLMKALYELEAIKD